MIVNPILGAARSRMIMPLAIVCCCCGSSLAFAQDLPSEQQVQYGGYLAWNTSEPYWFNRYVGVGLEQRNLPSFNASQEGFTSTNVVIGTQLFDRLMLSGNAGYLSWANASINRTQQLGEQPVYWGLSTRWRLNRRVDLKAQWQQIHTDQVESLLLMGIDVKLNF